MNTTGFEEILKNTPVYVLTEVGFCYSFNHKWALTKQELVDYFYNKLKKKDTFPERCCLFDRTIGEVPQKTTWEDVCWYCCIDEYPLEEIVNSFVRSECKIIKNEIIDNVGDIKKEIIKTIENFDPFK